MSYYRWAKTPRESATFSGKGESTRSESVWQNGHALECYPEARLRNRNPVATTTTQPITLYQRNEIPVNK
jgi:hypothetical protein